MDWQESDYEKISWILLKIDKHLKLENQCYYSASNLKSNSCIAFDRLMIELLDFHILFLSFPNAGFKGYGKNLLNRRLRITQLP